MLLKRQFASTVRQAPAIKTRTLKFTAAVALCAAFTVQAQDSTPFEEQYKLIKAPNAVARIGVDLFGDSVNLYTGTLDFTQTDVSLKGNNALPVAVGRRLTAGRRGILKRAFGRWELDIPHLHGIFAAGNLGKGWNAADSSNNRCSQFGAPAPAEGLSHMSSWWPTEFWQGNHVYIPGVGDKQLLSRDVSTNPYAPGPQVVDGVTVSNFPVLAAGQWAFGCLPSLANDTTAGKTRGEGFLAVSPDGTRYKFDWMVSYPTVSLHKADGGFATMKAPSADTDSADKHTPKPKEKKGGSETPSPMLAPNGGAILPTAEIWLLPTKVIDRFGNTVTYTYNPARPANLKKIASSDGRVIDITYVIDASGETNLIETVTDGSRTWRYAYHTIEGIVNLDRVTLPDNSYWNLSATDGLLKDLAFEVTGESCNTDRAAVDIPLSGTMVHPSGAKGVFDLRPVQHGRSDVPYYCIENEYVIDIPIHYYTNSLVKKSISGPGIDPMSWSYAYGPGNGSFAPCNGCDATQTVSITDPKGDVTRHTFGNRMQINEGKLLRTDVAWDGSSALRTTAVEYAPPGAGPYPEYMGHSDEIRGDSTTNRRNLPEKRRTITQQGVDFVWEADSFNEFVRPLTQSRRSSLGMNRTEITLFREDFSRWILAQVEKVTEASTNKVPVLNKYNETTGMLETVTQFGKLMQTVKFHADGTVHTSADELLQTTTYTDYRRGIAQNVLYADGTKASAVVNNSGTIDSITNQVGLTSSFKYDFMGRLERITHPTEPDVTPNPVIITVSQVNNEEFGIAAGHWRQQVSTGTARTTTYFDALLRPLYTETVDTADVTGTATYVKHAYDFQSNTTFQSYPKRTSSNLTEGVFTDYDALGRMTQRRADSELGTLTSKTDYLHGFVKRSTDARGNSTESKFQVFDQPSDGAITTIEAPKGLRITIDRDIFGKPNSITRKGDLKSAMRSYVYDDYGRLCKTIEPETGATVQYYDAANNVAWRATGMVLSSAACDYASVPTASKMVFGYDKMNRLKTTTFGDGSASISRTYTADGLPESITSDGAVWTNLYTNRRLHKQETLAYGGVNYDIKRKYDANGSLLQLTYPAKSLATQVVLDYLPNSLGQPTKVGNYAREIKYYPGGAIASFIYGNNVAHSMTPNLRGLPK
ncbi:MAG: hypothetical protein WKG03_02030, partial [Telluria sp.]